MRKRIKYIWTSLRIYDKKKYQDFSKICREAHSTTTRELNSFIARIAEAGRLEARDGK